MAGKRIIPAAGGVIWRPRRIDKTSTDGIEVLLVHRPHYADWTFPKGKCDPGEPMQVTAVREIAEETQLVVRLGHPLTRVDYLVSSGYKQVHYWMAQVVAGDTAEFEPNREVDELRWVKPRRAAAMLSYRHDRRLLDEFRALRDRKAHKAQPVILLRHATAVSRRGFRGDDELRPLTKIGMRQAVGLVPLLSAYGPHDVRSSPAVRCAATIAGYASATGALPEVDDRLAENASATQVKRAVRAAFEGEEPAVLCSHLPTLDRALEAINLKAADLRPSDGVVVHHRKGRVLATEQLTLRTRR